MTFSISPFRYTVYPGERVEVRYTITNSWGIQYPGAFRDDYDIYINQYGENESKISSGSVSPGETIERSFVLNTVPFETTESYNLTVRIKRSSDGRIITHAHADLHITTSFSTDDTDNDNEIIDDKLTDNTLILIIAGLVLFVIYIWVVKT